MFYSVFRHITHKSLPLLLGEQQKEFVFNNFLKLTKKLDKVNDGCYTGVSILTSYTEKPPVKKLPIFSEFIKNSAKFIKKSGLTKWTQNLR